MAWSLETTLNLISRNVTHNGYSVVNSDRTKLYLPAGSGTRNEGSFVVLEIDIATWTQTNISGSEAWSGNAGYHCRGIAIFRDELYIAIENQISGYQSYVYVWDGTGTDTWTESLQITDYNGSTGTINPQISADSEFLYAYADKETGGGFSASNNAGMHRFDGLAWTGPDQYNNTGDFEASFGLFGRERGQNGGKSYSVIYPNDSSFRLARYDASDNWINLGGQTNAGIQNFNGISKYFSFWIDPDGFVVASEDVGVTYYTTGTLQNPYGMIWNCDDGLVMGCTGFDQVTHKQQYTASVFSTYDSIPSASADARAFWRNEGTLYCITDSNIGTGGAIYSNAVPPPPPAELYFGVGTMQYVADLPFQKVAPQGMALRNTLGTLVIGSSIPDSEMVIYAENPYTSVVESDTDIPTGTSVSAIRWV